MNGSEQRTGRDGRLLALVIVVSLAVLLMLAKFRFAPSDGAPPPVTGPFERLTARSTYEDLAATIANLVQRLASSVVVVQLDPAPPQEKPGTGAKTRTPEPLLIVPPRLVPPRLVPAIRVGQDLAVIHLPAGFLVTDGQGLAAPIQLVASDAAREIGVLRASSVLDTTNGTANALAEFPGFSYVAVVEASIGGLTATPVFIGRADVATDITGWASPIRLLGGTPSVPVGALVFALDGRFIGLATATPAGGRALVPAAAIDAAVLTLTSGKGGF